MHIAIQLSSIIRGWTYSCFYQQVLIVVHSYKYICIYASVIYLNKLHPTSINRNKAMHHICIKLFKRSLTKNTTNHIVIGIIISSSKLFYLNIHIYITKVIKIKLYVYIQLKYLVNSQKLISSYT